MATDPWDEGSVSVELPAELQEWLDKRAGALGVDRQTVIVQLLSSYRAASSFDGELDAGDFFDDIAETLDVEAVVASALEERGEELVAGPAAAAVERELAERLTDEVEAAIEEHLPTITDVVEGRLGDRMDAMEAEFQEKVVDVRERVIEVKKDLDSKAEEGHDHEALDGVAALEKRVEGLASLAEDLEGTVEPLEAELAGIREDAQSMDERQDAIETRLSEAEQKLQRVAWALSDLKDEASGRSAQEEAVATIKRAAAEEGLRSASCENCGTAVDISLLADPECPHCEATVSDVATTSGFFRTKAELVTAAELEAGEE